MLPDQIASALQTLSAASSEELLPHSKEVLQVFAKLRQFLPADNSGVATGQLSTLRASPPSGVDTLIQESQAYLSLPREIPEESSSVQSSNSNRLNGNITHSCGEESWVHEGNNPPSSQVTHASACSAAPDSSLERFLTDQRWIDLSDPVPSSHQLDVNSEIPFASTDWTGPSTSQTGSHPNDQRVERSLLDLSWVDTSITPNSREPNNENGWPLFLPQTPRQNANTLPVCVPADCPSILSLDGTGLSSTSLPEHRQYISGSKGNQQERIAKKKNRYQPSDKLWEKMTSNKNVIEEYIKYPIDVAVGEPSSVYDDIRLVDIVCVDGQSNPAFQNIFRKVLAHRSITIQYQDWCGSSHANGRTRHFSRASFSRNGDFRNPKIVANALKYGLKLDRIEKAAKLPTASILFCVGFWEFKQTPEQDLVRLIERMEVSEPELWDILKANARWFEDCQALYSSMFAVLLPWAQANVQQRIARQSIKGGSMKAVRNVE
ncbi:hypothetical protein B0J12DRAFT_766252 [Macrophomina phaseolina]|uniref:Uncharacterized protein n=1 Tax=Macrophomina phaseolina TaxID=35725 RepID=A0ABQ8FXN7_9PEZI|nr:hypothetical protein B0J12DRAFT_766252 [Macrophomina phaseolina]